MNVTGCQLNIVWEDKPANYERVTRMLAQANLPPGSLVVLPELFATGFSMNVDHVCESTPSSTQSFLEALARRSQFYVIGGAAVRGADGRPRNQAIIVSPAGEVIGRYDKQQPFTLGGEAEHYAAGSELVLFDWAGFRVAPFICYDLRFPELFRAAVKRGAQLFAVIANWPVKRDKHWVALLQARAIENQAYVVGVNRCGTDPKYTYSGRSLIVDPHGRILTELGGEEGLASADVDLALLRDWRQEFPALQDMR